MADETTLHIQSAMVEEVLQNSLPDQITTLVQERQENAAEIMKHRAVLAEMEEQLKKGKQDCEQLTVEVNTLISKICALEEEGSKTALHVAELEKVIQQSDSQKEKLKLKERECHLSERKLFEYMKKIEDYKLVVEECERNCPTIKEVEAIKKDIEVLKAKKADMDTMHEHMTTGDYGLKKAVDDFNKEIMALEMTIDEERQMLNNSKVKLQEYQQKRLGMETANGILKKKNSALLTRLRHQVNAEKEKHEQIVNHIKYIQNKLEVTKLKLDNIKTEHSNN